MSSENSSNGFVLAHEVLKFTCETKSVDLDAIVTLTLSEHPGILITAGPMQPGSLGPANSFSSNEYLLEFPNSPSVRLVGYESDVEQGLVNLYLTPLKTPIRINHGKSGRLATFGIVNLTSFYARFPEQKSVKKDELEFQGGGWKLKISPWMPTRDGDVSTAEGRMYRVTHTASITKEDGGEFICDELENVLFSVRQFLSFACARSVATVFVKAFDDTGSTAMEWWGTGPLDPDGDVRTWWNHLNAQDLGACFGGFMSKKQDPEWQNAIQSAIYWYLRSAKSETGIDGNLVLIQAGLERLAWQILNKDRRVLLDTFDKLSAADKLRLLLEFSDVPLSIPVELSALTAAAGGFDWKDGPQALVQTRNRIIHPPTKAQSLPTTEVFYETWLLALWYLELVLLNCFNFNGFYANRTKKGQVELVPWATKI